jgi:hypothetical protein
MSNSQGWISLHRKLLDNPIFSNYKLLQTFLYCLLKASHSDREQLVGDELVTIKTGQLVTGRKAIAKATKLSEQNVRTALNRLEKLGILTIKPTNKYSIVTVVAWDLHQQTNQQVTNKQPTSNQQVTTNNNYNNVNNSNNKKEIVIPEGINRDSWTEWIEARKANKKKVSEAAAKKQFKLLLKYTEEEQKLIIDKSIQNDYQGLFDLKENGNGNYQANKRQNEIDDTSTDWATGLFQS